MIIFYLKPSTMTIWNRKAKVKPWPYFKFHCYPKAIQAKWNFKNDPILFQYSYVRMIYLFNNSIHFFPGWERREMPEFLWSRRIRMWRKKCTCGSRKGGDFPTSPTYMSLLQIDFISNTLKGEGMEKCCGLSLFHLGHSPAGVLGVQIVECNDTGNSTIRK